MNKFDELMLAILNVAQGEALKRKNTELTPYHLLYGMIKHPKSVSHKHLQKELKLVEGLLETLPTSPSINLKELLVSSNLQEWFAFASSRAIEKGRTEANESDFLFYVKKFFPQIELNPNQQGEEGESEVPDFLENLNELASKGKLDPVIGRSSEIRQVMEILLRRTKNNPVLVGLPGVGKTAIVEGLAGLINSGQVPDAIQGRIIYTLQMGALMSGTKYRGEFEEKIQTLLNFLKAKNREVILFIDEIHLLIGAGKTDGAMDAANLLKPALSRGELNCIGATTMDEYKKYIESDSALERRFHLVKVDAPSVEDSIEILTGLKEKLEIHHGVEITPGAIFAAAKLSDQYITDRNLPDKAIDVLDEAAASLKLSADSPPPEVIELETEIRAKKILLSASAEQQKSNLSEEIKKLEQECAQKKSAWESQVAELKKVALLKKELDQAQFEFQKKSQEGDFEAASRLKYTVIRDLEEKIKGSKVSWKLTEQNIATVVSKNTGIPQERLLSDHKQSIAHLESYLKSRVFGQDNAMKEIALTLLASHAGLTNANRPLGSFLLLGPSGVGKTETAKSLAQFLFHSERNLIRIDLSEYKEEHALAKLIGAPPGYVGFEKGGQLTEAVRRKPYSVILFDEIEKAHPNFADILLQILDDGRLTDAQWHVVNFKSTVIFVTSNLKNFESYLKPELIGRFDSILHFQNLSAEVIKSLIQRELEELNGKMKPKNIQFHLSKKVEEKIASSGFDERYGARPLKNAFNRVVIRPLAQFLTQGEQKPGKYQMDLNEQNFLKISLIPS